MASPQEVYKAWQWEFDGAYKYGRSMMLTMQLAIGRLARVTALEHLIKYKRSRQGAEQVIRCMSPGT